MITMKKYLVTAIFFIITISIISVVLLKVNYTRNIIKNIYYFGVKETLSYKFSKCASGNLNSSKYSTILIAGHTYGLFDHKNNATYPKLLYALEAETKKNKKVEKIILAGDIVKKARVENFLQVKNEFANFSKMLIVAPGNHDYGSNVLGSKENQKDFLKVFKKSFQSIKYKDNIFFILDTATNPGNVTVEQINYIKEELKRSSILNNIFIITHHVIWRNFVKKPLEPNLPILLENNFNQLFSAFKNSGIRSNIYFIAGDIGVAQAHTKLFCEKKNNIYFIATGMGNGRLDNYLKLMISEDGKTLSIEPVFF